VRNVLAPASCVEYLEGDMTNTPGFESRDLPDLALAEALVDAHFLKFSVVGMQRDIASSKPVQSLSLPREGFRPVRGAFLRDGDSPQIPANMELRKVNWFSDTNRPRSQKVIRRLPNRVDRRL
jgi:hypothetical protein